MFMFKTLTIHVNDQVQKGADAIKTANGSLPLKYLVVFETKKVFLFRRIVPETVNCASAFHTLQ